MGDGGRGGVLHLVERRAGRMARARRGAPAASGPRGASRTGDRRGRSDTGARGNDDGR